MASVRMSIDVPPALHRTIKAHAAEYSETMREYVIEAVMKRVRKERVLNETTIKALEATDRGQGLKRYTSAKDLYKDLGI